MPKCGEMMAKEKSLARCPHRLPEIIVATLILAAVAVAQDSESSTYGEETIEEFEKSVMAARALCYGILVEIREIRTDYPPEGLTDNLRKEARDRLDGVSIMAELYEDAYVAATKHGLTVSELIEDSQALGIYVDDSEWRARRASELLKTCSRYVSKFYDRSVTWYGIPPSALSWSFVVVEAMDGDSLKDHGVPVYPGVHVQTDVTSCFGTSRFVDQGGSTGAGESDGSIHEGSVQAIAWLPTGTRLQVKAGSESQMQRRRIGLRHVDMTAQHSLPRGWLVDAGLGHNNYKNKTLHTGEFGETTWKARISRNGTGPTFSAGVRRRSRAFLGDDASGRDWTVTNLQTSASLPFEKGQVNVSVTHADHDGDDPELSFQILRPGITFELGDPGMELHLSLEHLESPGTRIPDSDRICGRIRHYMHREPRRVASVGPEIQWNRFPEGNGAEYIDLGLVWSAFGITGRPAELDGRRNRLSQRLYYRWHKDDSTDNWIGFHHHGGRWPRRSGRVWESGLSCKAYMGSANYSWIGLDSSQPSVEEASRALGEIVQEFYKTRPPHMIDLHYRLGYLLQPGQTTMRLFEFSAGIGHKMFIDDERDQLQKEAEKVIPYLPDSVTVNNPLGDHDFLYRHPLNRAQGGGRIRWEIAPVTGCRMRASAQFDAVVFYNHPNTIRMMNSLDTRISLEYIVTRNLRLEGLARYHRGFPGEFDTISSLERSQYALYARYRFQAGLL